MCLNSEKLRYMTGLFPAYQHVKAKASKQNFLTFPSSVVFDMYQQHHCVFQGLRRIHNTVAHAHHCCLKQRCIFYCHAASFVLHSISPANFELLPHPTNSNHQENETNATPRTRLAQEHSSGPNQQPSVHQTSERFVQ